MTTQKTGKNGRGNTGTRRKKNTQSVNGDHSEVSGKSREKGGKRMAIDVTTLIKSRSKTRSSMSHRAPSRK